MDLNTWKAICFQGYHYYDDGNPIVTGIIWQSDKIVFKFIEYEIWSYGQYGDMGHISMVRNSYSDFQTGETRMQLGNELSIFFLICTQMIAKVFSNWMII